MPSHELHEIIDLMILGKKYSEIHDFLDQMQPFMQSRHRMYYHDMRTVEMITRVTGDLLAGEAAYLHIKLDEISDIYGKTESVPLLLEMIRRGEIRL